MQKQTTHSDIVILGAGIGGFEVFRKLNHLLKQHGLLKRITIVDSNNYFTFTPLLHEVASGSVEPGHCTAPIRELIYKTPHHFLNATVTELLPQDKTVVTSEGTLTYDYCVLALGSGVNFFNTPGADTHAYTVRTLPKAMQFRQTLLKKLEAQPRTLHLTVVGGGYTGVEVAGQLAYFREHTLKKLYKDTVINLRVVEASTTVVPQLPVKAQQIIIKRLKKLNVDLLLNKRVTEVGSSTITFDGNEALASDMTLWCTGIANKAEGLMDAKDCLKGRLPLTNFLNHALYPTLYGVGDTGYGTNKGSEVPYPQLGELAHRQGTYVAEHIMATILNETIKPFFFTSRGTLMPIGDRYALIIRGNYIFTGWFAWWIRRTVYLLFMPGLMRKLKIMLDWTLHLFGFGYIIAIDQTLNKK